MTFGNYFSPVLRGLFSHPVHLVSRLPKPCNMDALNDKMRTNALQSVVKVLGQDEAERCGEHAPPWNIGGASVIASRVKLEVGRGLRTAPRLARRASPASTRSPRPVRCSPAMRDRVVDGATLLRGLTLLWA